MTPHDDVELARRWVEDASRIVVFTGAGVSAESGVPTFRDALTGLWARHDPYRLATAEGFAADPPLVWRWYAWRRQLVRDVEPNAAHGAIARLEHDRSATVVTQNVDGLHARAGARDVIELHGNIARATCFDGCGWSGDPDRLEATDARMPPHCPSCGGFARPDVVWFGEMLPISAWDRAEAACRAADLCIAVGTSGVVQPAAGLPELTRRTGGRVIVVDPHPSALEPIADIVLRGKAGEVVPQLLLSSSTS